MTFKADKKNRFKVLLLSVIFLHGYSLNLSASDGFKGIPGVIQKSEFGEAYAQDLEKTLVDPVDTQARCREVQRLGCGPCQNRFSNHERYMSETPLGNESSQSRKKILILTLPKSGTHMLKKILPMILGKDLSVLYSTGIEQDPWNPPYIPEDQDIIFSHVYPGFDLYRKCDDSTYIKVLLIRDLRDAVISFANWVHRSGQWGPWVSKEVISKFNQLDFQERILESILFPDEYLGLKLFSRKAVEWMEDPSVFVCRFEELVGLEGGGNRRLQKTTISALAKHLGYPLTQRRVTYIADHLFGDSPTFSEGQIGSWRSHFNENHKKIFKTVMGKELIKMGYEVNNDW